jgi:prevent-host-death family protein
MVRLSATEVARDFSRVLSRVERGEEVEVVRNGVPVAQMRPAKAEEVVSAARWREVMEGAPSVDEDIERDGESTAGHSNHRDRLGQADRYPMLVRAERPG